MNRAGDVILSIFCLSLGSIILLIITISILLVDGSPVMFKQIRIGKGMKSFNLYKFRSMKAVQGHNTLLTIGSDPRITRLGKFLRKFHLDELPQLFNILGGDMSFIGPRPEIPEFVDRENPVQQEVLKVRPGLFDYATLYWLNEDILLAGAKDWKQYYRTSILPDKLNKSLEGIRNRSIKNNARLILKIVNKILLHNAE